MEPKVVESKKDILKVEFNEIDHGIMSLIKDKLWEDKATEMAGYQVTHPEKGVLKFTLRTKGKEAKKVWNETLDRIQKELKEFDSEIKKLK